LEAARVQAISADGRFNSIEASISAAAAQQRLGDPSHAYAQASDALEEARRYRYEVLVGHASTLLGQIELDRGNLEDGLVCAVAGLASHRETGHRLGEADALTLLAAYESDAEVAGALRNEGSQLYARVRETCRNI
jgi:hypothetical protein